MRPISSILSVFVPGFISRRIERITPEALDRWLDRKFSGHSRNLLRGDRRAAAEATWPVDRYPTNYMDIPADVRRPVVWDGRLLAGIEVPWLAWRHVKADLVAPMMRASGSVGARAGVLLTLILFAVAAMGLYDYQSPLPYPAWAEGVASDAITQWYTFVALDIAAHIGVALMLAMLAGLFLIPAASYFHFARKLGAWWNRATENLRTPTRDSLVIYKHKADIRDAEYRAYFRQAKDAAGRLSEQPLITVGKATGVLRARGDMEAPSTGQTVALDGESIRQHTLILGGTGSGKTRLAVRPLVRRILSAEWGEGHRIGAYVTDGKGTLWQDLIDTPEVSGRDDVKIVGTGAGQAGVNLLAGMTPLEVATTLKAVSGQVAGMPSDDFWPESASLLMMHAATVARVLDMDPEIDSNPQWQDCRPWSLVGIGRIATDWAETETAMARIAELRNLHPEEAGFDLWEALDGEELISSVRWLNGTWYAMAHETKSGIVGNINVVLGKLPGAGDLRRRFCTGRFDGPMTDVNHALNGGILMIAVGETSWGMVGKVVSVWLKTRLFIEARKALETDRASRAKTSVAMICDEWQMLATTGPDSDASFWNIARETGVFGIMATQSLAALQQVLGDEPTSNLVNLLRTKIVLKTEEIGTLEYCIKLAGESLRGIVTDDEFYETQGQREIERPDRTPSADLSEKLSLGSIFPSRLKFSTGSMESAVRLDKRFLRAAGGFFGQSGKAEEISSQQAAYWRQEDREKELRGAGLEFRPKLTTDELLLGSGMAFAIVQRAGGDRSDIIDLHTD